ncbi:MAG: response regulator, partial [Gammaproteobacteria bacterium]|nr:response regulator [Gammaproteobacteria bacterium]
MGDLKTMLQSKKVLIVDDEALMRSFLSAIVKRIGFKRVTEARDGKSALEMIDAESFDVVFCDWEMPGMDGLQLYKHLKNIEAHDDLVFIMATGHTGAAHVKEAMENGVK